MFFLPALCMAESETGTEYTYKIAIERHLEDRLKTVLRDVAKGWSIVVVVNAEVRAEAKELAKKRKGKDKKQLLPGVPVREEMTPGTKAPTISPADASVLIKSLDITVLVDSAAPDGVLETIHDLAISVAGYNPDRGDRLEVRRVDFLTQENFFSLINPTNIIIFAISVVGIVFLSAAALFFLNPFRSLSVVLKNVDWDSIRGQDRRRDPNRAPRPAPGVPGAGPAVPGQPQAVIAGRPQNSGAAALGAKQAERKGRFSFVDQENIHEVAYLLSEADAEDISIALSYIGPELSTRLLAHFPVETQAKAAAYLSEAREMDHNRVDSLEKSLKERLEYVVGGHEHLATILDLADDEVRERTIESVEQRDVDTALKIRKKVKSVESVARDLSKKDLQTLIRRLDISIFARVLNTLPGDVKAKALEALEGGGAELLEEELKFAGTFPPDRLRLEKRAIIQVYRELLEAGEIQEEAVGTMEG
jgi:hypothetical protein